MSLNLTRYTNNREKLRKFQNIMRQTMKEKVIFFWNCYTPTFKEALCSRSRPETHSAQGQIKKMLSSLKVLSEILPARFIWKPPFWLYTLVRCKICLQNLPTTCLYKVFKYLYFKIFSLSLSLSLFRRCCKRAEPLYE